MSTFMNLRKNKEYRRIGAEEERRRDKNSK
jgi:hypothetical protein